MFPHNVKYKPFFVNICFLAFGCHHWAAAEYDERRKYGRCHDGSRKASSADVDLMARLLRAEAEGEGKQGMLLVGNVGINRVRANCSDFKGLRTIRQMVFQPHAFEAVTHGYFTRDRVNPSGGLPAGTLTENGFGRLSSVCGTLSRRATARRLGMASRLSPDSDPTASISRQVRRAKTYTIHFDPGRTVLKMNGVFNVL